MVSMKSSTIIVVKWAMKISEKRERERTKREVEMRKRMREREEAVGNAKMILSMFVWTEIYPCTCARTTA